MIRDFVVQLRVLKGWERLPAETCFLLPAYIEIFTVSLHKYEFHHVCSNMLVL
jgi:hypothetical protein